MKGRILNGMDKIEKRQRGRPRAFSPSEAGSVQSLDRALRILAIVAEGSGLSLSDRSYYSQQREDMSKAVLQNKRKAAERPAR